VACMLPKKMTLNTLLLSALVISGCSAVSHDAALDNRQINKDQPVAEELARKLFSSELSCDKVTDKVLSRHNVEGAPMGPVWTNYSIAVSGCGKTSTYVISCKGVLSLSKPYCAKKGS